MIVKSKFKEGGKSMYNKDIRSYAKEHGVFLWQVARVMGISDLTMTRRLRTPLTEQDRAEFIRIIDELSAQNNATND